MEKHFKFYEKNDGVFKCLIGPNSTDLETNIIKLLLIISKHYPKYQIRQIAVKDFNNWEAVYLSGKITSYFTVRFQFYYMENGLLNFGFVNDCMTVDIDDPKTSDENLTSITFNFQPVVDKFNYIILNEFGDEIIIEEDQSEAAKLNRSIISDFLKDIESYYGEIKEYNSSGVIDIQYLYKFGILENAVQSNF